MADDVFTVPDFMPGEVEPWTRSFVEDPVPVGYNAGVPYVMAEGVDKGEPEESGGTPAERFREFLSRCKPHVVPIPVAPGPIERMLTEAVEVRVSAVVPGIGPTIVDGDV